MPNPNQTSGRQTGKDTIGRRGDQQMTQDNGGKVQTGQHGDPGGGDAAGLGIGTDTGITPARRHPTAGRGL